MFEAQRAACCPGEVTLVTSERKATDRVSAINWNRLQDGSADRNFWLPEKVPVSRHPCRKHPGLPV